VNGSPDLHGLLVHSRFRTKLVLGTFSSPIVIGQFRVMGSDHTYLMYFRLLIAIRLFPLPIIVSWETYERAA
jgi:hypothetical protein